MICIENNILGTALKVFYSKKDWWVWAFLICMTGLLLQLLITMFSKGTAYQFPVHTAVYIVTIFLLWWPVLNTRYTIKDETLNIRILFLTWNIKLSAIQKISATNNSVASPALSLDRLKIDYIKEGKSKFILVSPRNKAKFCQAVGQHLSE